MLLRTAVGIEIAGQDLRIAVVRSTMGKLRLLQSVEIPGFAEMPQEEQRGRVAQIVKKDKLPASHVFLSLPRDHGIVRQIEFPVEVREKLRSAVALQMETLSPWPVEDIYWDFAQEKVKKGAKTIVITVVIIPRVALDPWIEFFKAAKLPLSGACLSSLSCAHGVQALWTDANPALVLDCEPGYVEGSLLSGSSLASVTQIGEEVSAAAKTVVERLASMGRINSLESARMIAYGSGVASIESLERVTLPLENARPESSDSFGAIASALVLAKKTALEANLVPRQLRYRRSQLQLLPTYILIVVAVLFGMAMALREPYQLRVYAAKISEEIRKIAPEVTEIAVQEAELNKLSGKYRVLTSHFQGRDFNLEALRELARALPEAVWLSNYSYQDRAMTVTGFAPSAADVQKVLEDDALFKEVTFTSSVTREPNGKDRFSLKASIEVTR